ncbi:MAG: threonine synthase [Muribaculaceae bacterium]|nr:threonine synthase [Muribaculaceae bacterium]
MKYYSTNQPQNIVGMQEAVTASLPADGGLYMPLSLPKIPAAFVHNMGDMSLREIAYVTSNVFLGEDFDSSEIKRIVDNALSFDIPLVEISENRFALELFHGPTGVFKDIGTRFLAGLLEAVNRNDSRKLNVLVSTTGNTGVAVASAFGGMKGVKVYILYPYGTVSKKTASIMLASGDNIHAIEVSGGIDDCKKMVSSAFRDKELRETVMLSSANSTNFARLIPQLALFFYATGRMANSVKPIRQPFDIALPSGNLGMLTAGLMAKYIGLKCGQLIGACNVNNTFDRYMKSGVVESAPTIRTLAPLMDMPDPSNLPRLMALAGGDLQKLRSEVSSATVDDDMIVKTIRQTALTTGYIADPHTAIAIAALNLRDDKLRPGLVFATAAPSKSADIINEIIGAELLADDSDQIPVSGLRQRAERLAPTYPALKKYLLSHNNNL